MSLNAAQKAEIKSLKEEKSQTIRPCVAELEKVLFEPIPLLDHGFIRVVDYMGDDAAIVQAARVSYGKGTKQVNQDAGLINYLIRHRHTTPFEMCEIKLHIKMPIFVARQWIRHRTANVNEYSARYSVLDNEFYIPTAENLAAQSTKNHQGRGEEKLSDDEMKRVLEILNGDANKCYEHYKELINADDEGNVLDENKKGIARELARMNLPINIYTQWYWKIDLHNLMHFVALRADEHAQYEIRVYAQAILDIIQKWVPVTFDAFMNHVAKGTRISEKGMNAIRRMIKGEVVSQESSGMGKREWEELNDVLSKD